ARLVLCFFFQAEDGIRDRNVTGVQTCALPIYSWPAFLKFPTNSFFFVSTEMTGCWRCRNATAVALMCSNCALRSGCELPSWILRSEERRVGKECSYGWAR